MSDLVDSKELVTHWKRVIDPIPGLATALQQTTTTRAQLLEIQHKQIFTHVAFLPLLNPSERLFQDEHGVWGTLEAVLSQPNGSHSAATWSAYALKLAQALMLLHNAGLVFEGTDARSVKHLHCSDVMLFRCKDAKVVNVKLCGYLDCKRQPRPDLHNLQTMERKNDQEQRADLYRLGIILCELLAWRRLDCIASALDVIKGLDATFKPFMDIVPTMLDVQKPLNASNVVMAFYEASLLLRKNQLL